MIQGSSHSHYLWAENGKRTNKGIKWEILAPIFELKWKTLF